MSTILKSLKKCEQAQNNSADPDLQRILQGGQPSEAKKKSLWPWVFSVSLILNAIVIVFYFPKFEFHQSRAPALQETFLQPEKEQVRIPLNVPGDVRRNKVVDHISNSASKNMKTDQISSELSGKFPEASIRYLSQSELTGLSIGDLQIMRNEIFARHSYIFKTTEITDYFSQFSWYIPKFEDITSMLTEIEIENIQRIQISENR